MTKQLIVFQEDYPAIIIIMLGLLLIGLVLRDWIKESKSRRVLRVIAAVLVVIALLGIIVAPAVRRPIERSNLVILTEGHRQAQLDSLNRQLPKFTVLGEDSILNTTYPDLDEFGQVFVLGNGIPTYDLWQFKGRQVSYLEGIIENGITQLNVPNAVYEGAEMTIKGSLKTDLQSEKLMLSGPEGKLDSVVVGADGHFELNTRPKTNGDFVYTISISTNERIEKVPVRVLPQKRLRVLMINAFPTFETRYLKAFLSRKGHEVVVRNQVSKTIYKYEYFNTNKRSVNRLTQGELDNQDLVIIDLESLDNLLRTERQLLKAAINEEGLGLFIQPEQGLFTNRSWINIRSKRTDAETVSFSSARDTVALSKYGLELTLQSNQYELLQGSNQGVIAMVERSGLGKVGTTVLKDIYRQQLTGDSLIYAKIWTGLLNGLSKENNDNVSWSGLDQLIYPLEPMKFTVQNLNAEVTMSIDGQNIPLAQDANIPEQWHGNFWPRASGWYKTISEQDSSAFYVYEQGEWNSRRDFSRTAANQTFFSQQAVSTLNENYHHKAIPKVWFYILFLLAIGFLWLEPKL